MKKWKLVELAMAFVEYEITMAWRTGVTVSHDVRLPLVDGSGARARQIDILVTAGDRRRIVEVKDWAEPVDQPVVDNLIGLMQSVGIDEAAIVSTGGYTEGALKRLVVNPDITPYNLRPPREDEPILHWPSKTLGVQANQTDGDEFRYEMEIAAATYEKAIEQERILDAHYGVIDIDEPFVARMVVSLIHHDGQLVPFVIGKWPPEKVLRWAEFQFAYTLESGEKRTAQSEIQQRLVNFDSSFFR